MRAAAACQYGGSDKATTSNGISDCGSNIQMLHGTVPSMLSKAPASLSEPVSSPQAKPGTTGSAPAVALQNLTKKKIGP